MSVITKPSAATHTATPTFAAGTPGRLAEWGFTLIGEALRSSAPEHLHVLSDAQQLATLAAHDRALVQTFHPNAAFREAAAEHTVGEILFIGNPENDVKYLERLAGMQGSDRMRTATSSAVANWLAHSPRALVVSEAERSAHDAVARVCAHLGITDPAITDALKAKYGGARSHTSLSEALDLFSTDEARSTVLHAALPEPDLDAIERAVRPLYEAILSGQRRPLVWPREWFFEGDSPGQPGTRWVDLAGGARTLFYGPYLCLPEGRWRLTLVVAFADEVSGLEFSIEFANGPYTARKLTRVQRAGTYQASFEINVEFPEINSEVRISSREGCIFGQIAIGDTVFEPIDADV